MSRTFGIDAVDSAGIDPYASRRTSSRGRVGRFAARPRAFLMQQATPLHRPLRPKAEIVYRALGTGGVLVDLERDEIFELNRTAARIWALITEGVSDEALLSALTTEFDIDEAAALVEIERFHDTLRREGLLR